MATTSFCPETGQQAARGATSQAAAGWGPQKAVIWQGGSGTGGRGPPVSLVSEQTRAPALAGPGHAGRRPGGPPRAGPCSKAPPQRAHFL